MRSRILFLSVGFLAGTALAVPPKAKAQPQPKPKLAPLKGLWTLKVQNGATAGACVHVPVRFTELEKHLNAKHKKKCALQENGEALFYDCQGIAEGVFFTKEECLLIEKKPLTDKQKRHLIAFKSCYGPYRKLSSVEDAASYCTCVGEKMSTRYDEKQLKKMSEDQVRDGFEKISKECGR